MKATIFFAISMLSLSGPAIAQDQPDWQAWPLFDHFNVSVSAFFQSLDSHVRLDASDGSPGTKIDFEQDLGMSQSENVAAIGLGWRFAKKHRLQLETFDVKRGGFVIAATDIYFGDEIFSVALPISSFFDLNVTALNYSYSLIFDQKKEFAVDLGVSVEDMKFGLAGNQGLGIIDVNSGLSAPLPTIGLRVGYAFSDKWIGKAGVGVFSFDFAVSDEDRLSGRVINMYASIQHNTFEHIHFGRVYANFNVVVDFFENSMVNSIDYQYQGPLMTITAAF